MFIECPECHAKTYISELPPFGKQYRCRQCATVFFFRQAEDTVNREKKKARTVFSKSEIVQRLILIVAISLLFVILGGTSFALAKPEHALAAPFKGVAITVTETSRGAVDLIVEIRAVVATYERNIISVALQSMRMIENLDEISPVTVSINDMAKFPSREHPLFPDYLDKRFSQFRYTVNSEGIINVDTSGATTDALLEKTKQLLNRLEGR